MGEINAKQRQDFEANSPTLNHTNIKTSYEKRKRMKFSVSLCFGCKHFKILCLQASAYRNIYLTSTKNIQKQNKLIQRFFSYMKDVLNYANIRKFSKGKKNFQEILNNFQYIITHFFIIPAKFTIKR